MSTNPYLSMTELAALNGLLDANSIAVIVGPGGGQGSSTSMGSIPLASFRDNYLLVTVNEQITALQNKPGNGAFASPVTMYVTGVVTGQTSFDGSSNFSLNLTMPDNSIPISAVQNLASTIASLESEAAAPTALGSSYYSNLNASSQSSVLGYWNASSTNTNGEDQFGTVLQLTSDGAMGPNASNYVNQLLFGTNGTLNWRRNVNNTAWTLVQLWHSGNFTPSNYATLAGAPTFTNGASFSTTATELDVSFSSNNTQAYRTYFFINGTTAGFARTDTNGAYVASALYWNVQTGALNFPAAATFGSTINSGAITSSSTVSHTYWISTASNFGQVTGTGSTGSAFLWGPGGSGDNIWQVTRAASSSYANTFYGSIAVSQGTAATGLTVTTSGSTHGVIIQDTGGNGANLEFIGNGSTTPNKTLRAVNGHFALVNNAYSAEILTCDDAGNFGVTGSITGGALTATSGTFSQQINANGTTALEATWPQATGTIANGGGGGNYGVTNHANNDGGSNATSCAAMTFIRDGVFGAYFGLDTDNNWKVGGWSYGNNSYQIAHSGLSSFTFGGTVSSVGVANFNTSDRRLKKNIHPRDPRPLHRKLKWYGYDRVDIQESGLGPLAQEARKVEPLYVREYDHPLKDTGGKTVKRLTIDKSGIAMEEAMWAGHAVDRVAKELAKMETRLAKAEATIRKLKAKKAA